MIDLPAAIINVFALFSPLFSRPVYQNAFRLFVGHILCTGRRTVADILKTLDLDSEKNFSRYHWVLSGARWSAYKGSNVLILKILSTFSMDADIYFTVDSTVERRKGAKLKNLGSHRDAVRSTKKQKVLTIGINWLVCSVNVKLPGANSHWSLPFISIPMPPKDVLSSSKNHHDLHKKKRHKTMTTWTRQIVFTLRRWLGKTASLILVGDSAFATFELMYACQQCSVSLISRLRLDARLYDFIPTNPKLKRKRVVGNVLPKLTEVSKKNIKEWDEIEVKWYGGKTKKLYVQSGKCLWYYIGFSPVAIHWVLIKDSEKNEAIALFSTNLEHSVKTIIEAYVSRWSIELTFEEVRRHLGFETQRQWSDKAIDRTTPIILASYSIITVMAFELAKERCEKIALRSTAWYKKTHLTFSDVLFYLRKSIREKQFRALVGKKGDCNRKNIKKIILQAMAA